MQVGILGSLEVRAGDVVVAIGGARLRTVLARLALDAGRTVPAGTLADAVWPGGTGTRHALHSLMTRLRRALPAAGCPPCSASRPSRASRSNRTASTASGGTSSR